MYTNTGEEMIRRVHESSVHLCKSRFYAQVLRTTGRLLGDPQQQPMITFVATRHLQSHHAMTAEQHQASAGAFAQHGRPQTEPK